MKVISSERKPIKLWVSSIEGAAKKQLRNVANLPFIFKHVAAMPDVHAGKGSTIGTVIATQGAIIPACVGVDIGCGMAAVRLSLKIDQFENLPKLRKSIERSIPTGFHGNKTVGLRVLDALNRIGVDDIIADGLDVTKRSLIESCAYKLGSLGGGNHFIEICGDENGDTWLMLHSGSRAFGNKLAQIHIKQAKGLMKQYFIENLADPDLAYLVQDTIEFENYINDLMIAQKYAKENRHEMVQRVLKDISYHVFGRYEGPHSMGTFMVDCHHNYTTMENHFGKNVWVTRKGAISARKGEFGIVPGSMGTKSYIVQGLGNPESFMSCSHGAGRIMSRTIARKIFTKEDLEQQTKGVECSKSINVIDEIPGAYKDIDEVMENQKDLVKPVHTLKQILCVKGEK